VQLANSQKVFTKENNVKKLMIFLFALAFLMSTGAVAQDNGMKQDTMKSGSSAKATSVTGKISDDGKSFVSDDGKTWTISNPDAVKGHEGHHVTLKAQTDADKGSVQVISLKMAKDNMKKDSMQH
jgi:hypothetical protein